MKFAPFPCHALIPALAFALVAAGSLRPQLLSAADQDLAQITIRTWVIRAPDGSAFEDLPGAPRDSTAQAGGLASPATILLPADAEKILSALKKPASKDQATIITSPILTTRDGQRCKFEIIREMIYPTEYDPPEIPNGFDLDDLNSPDRANGVFPVTPSNPTAFEARNVGLTFEYDPHISEDGELELVMALEKVHFQGFINYGSPITTNAKDKDGNNAKVVLTENRIVMPVFSVRKLSSSVRLPDGHYVLLGGLPELPARDIEEVLTTGEKGADGAVKSVTETPDFKETADHAGTGPLFFLITASVAE